MRQQTQEAALGDQLTSCNELAGDFEPVAERFGVLCTVRTGR